MSKATSIHPAEQFLLDRAKALGLTGLETAVVSELLGWVMNHGDPPVYYRSILPQMVMMTEYREMNADERKSHDDNAVVIGDVIKRLIGQDLVAKMQDDPVGVLQTDLKLGAPGAAWVVVQLKLTKHYKRFDGEIKRMQLFAPELMPSRIVAPVIGLLLEKAKP